MKLHRALRVQSGYTIQELLVVMLVSSLLIGFCLGVFLFSSKLFGNWEKKRELAGAVERTVQVISMDIQRAKNIETLGDSMLVLSKGIGVRTSYRFTAGTVLRDSIPIVASSEIVLQALVKWTDTLDVLRVRVVGRRNNLEHTAESRVSLKPNSKATFSNALSGANAGNVRSN